jgi:hypothetical protein
LGKARSLEYVLEEDIGDPYSFLLSFSYLVAIYRDFP